MVPMAHWAVIISADRYATERLFHHDTLAVPGFAEEPAGSSGGVPGDTPSVDDEVLIVVGGKAAGDEKPVVVALGRFHALPDGPGGSGGDALVVAYTRRSFDQPMPADQLSLDGLLSPVAPEVFARLAARFAEPAERRTWLVSLDLPIEAESPAEAVRQFWSYVQELGPRELPTFVSPYGDELAMQAFVLGEEANQDPEEDEDD
jgi:hypothetical protein